jgi:hypothetical protein
VVDVLETLNLLCESRQCYVVLGIDPETVQRSVEVRYAELIDAIREANGDATTFGKRFLEKSITVAVSVPTVPAAHTVAFASKEDPPPNVLATLARNLTTKLDRLALIALSTVLLAFAGFWAEHNPSRIDDLMALFGAEPVGGSHGADDEAESTGRPTPNLAGSGTSAATAAATTTSSEREATAPGPEGASTRPASPDAKEDDSKPAADPMVLRGSPRPLRPATVQAQLAPAVITTDAAVSEKEARSYAEQQVRLLSLAGYVTLAVLIVSLIALLLRLRRVQQRERPAEDSEEFKRGLADCLTNLPSNPRRVIRFTNLARLLFYLTSVSEPERAQDPEWVERFFDFMLHESAMAPRPGSDASAGEERAALVTELRSWSRSIET